MLSLDLATLSMVTVSTHGNNLADSDSWLCGNVGPPIHYKGKSGIIVTATVGTKWNNRRFTGRIATT